MMEWQSTLFPLYDRNSRSWVANIVNASLGDHRGATQSVRRGGSTPSAVMLPVVADAKLAAR